MWELLPIFDPTLLQSNVISAGELHFQNIFQNGLGVM